MDNLPEAKIAELEKMKEELRQAKDEVMQSWLDSRPLIDKLEKMQAELATAKSRVSKANNTISELQAQLGTTDMCIKSTKDQEQNYWMMNNDKNQDLHKTQEDMGQLKMKIDRKRRRRSKIKLVLRLKMQTLKTLQLTYGAIRLESEAFSSSAAQALSHISNSEAANTMVQLNREEYDNLKREAEEQTSLAEWRISVSLEEKLAAENSRDTAFKRLLSLYPRNISSQRKMEQTFRKETRRNNQVRNQTSHRDFSNAQAKSPTGVNKRNPQQKFKRNSYSYVVRKKKLSIFFRIKVFFVQKIWKFFK